MVGLTGYPNVGKSSTINALFGSKKTAVAPTPGKTKHFQVGRLAGNCNKLLQKVVSKRLLIVAKQALG